MISGMLDINCCRVLTQMHLMEGTYSMFLTMKENPELLMVDTTYTDVVIIEKALHPMCTSVSRRVEETLCFKKKKKAWWKPFLKFVNPLGFLH